MDCPRCGATLKFSSEENEMVCEVCYYVSESEPEAITPSRMSKLLSANAHRKRDYRNRRSLARSARELAYETN